MTLLIVLVSIVTLGYASQATSPQLLYMQSLQNQLKPLARVNIRSAEGGPQEQRDSAAVLLATSIGGVYAQGADLSGRKFELKFRVLVERGYRDIDIQKSELLLFPNVTGPLPPTLQIDFTATVADFGLSVRLTYAWDTSQSCVSLDITPLMKNIFRRSPSDGMVVALRVDVGLVLSDPQNKSDHSTGACVMQEYQSNVGSVPFIVTKYFVESRRNYVIAPRQTGVEGKGCNLSTLLINVSAIFGPNVILPTTLDIGSCAGSCEQGSNENYSYNAIAKRRMRALDPNGAMLERMYDVNCVPISFDPVALIISDKYSGMQILEIPNLVVRSCACR